MIRLHCNRYVFGQFRYVFAQYLSVGAGWGGFRRGWGLGVNRIRNTAQILRNSKCNGVSTAFSPDFGGQTHSARRYENFLVDFDTLVEDSKPKM